MRQAALIAITLYQRYISPYKGFCCAYRRHTGRAGCSALGYRAIRRHGVIKGAQIVRQRTRLCGEVHRQSHLDTRRPIASRRGDCDIGCVPCDLGCDLPEGRGLSKACQFVSCCDCASCDWPRKQKDKKA